MSYMIMYPDSENKIIHLQCNGLGGENMNEVDSGAHLAKPSIRLLIPRGGGVYLGRWELKQ